MAIYISSQVMFQQQDLFLFNQLVVRLKKQ